MSSEPIVYVVDDDPSIRRSLLRILALSGWQVQAYESGSAFLDAYETGQIGCIVLDVLMPGMSGLEVQAQLSARGNTMPIIVVTAFGAAMAEKMLQNGAFGLLEKPVQNQQLISLIKQAIDGQTSPPETSIE